YISTNSIVPGTPRPVVVIDLTTFAVSTIAGSNVGGSTLQGRIASTPDGRFVVVPRQSPNSLLIIDTATKKLAQTVSLAVTPIAIDITRNANDGAGIFGYLLETSANGPGIAVVDFRPGSPTFGQIISGAIANAAALQPAINIALSPDGTRVIAVASAAPPASNTFVFSAPSLRTSPATPLLTQ